LTLVTRRYAALADFLAKLRFFSLARVVLSEGAEAWQSRASKEPSR
jgi:hypothetical protein